MTSDYQKVVLQTLTSIYESNGSSLHKTPSLTITIFFFDLLSLAVHARMRKQVLDSPVKEGEPQRGACRFNYHWIDNASPLRRIMHRIQLSTWSKQLLHVCSSNP